MTARGRSPGRRSRRVAAGQRRRAARLGDRRLVVLVGVLVAWEVIVRALRIKQFILPRPSAIVAALADVPAASSFAAAATRDLEAVGGLVIGATAGIVGRRRHGALRLMQELAAAVRRGRQRHPDHRLRADDEQLVRASSSRCRKMMIAAVMVFFPVMVNAVRGLTHGRAGRARADALVRRVRVGRSSASSGSRTHCRTSSPRSKWRPRSASSARSSASTSAAPRRSLGRYIATQHARSCFDGRGRRSCWPCAIGIVLYLVVVVARTDRHALARGRPRPE